MKKALALIIVCAIFLAVGYGCYLLTGYDFFWIIPVGFAGMLVAIHLLGLVFWLLEYIGKSEK